MTIEPTLVGDVVHCIDNKIDGYDIYPAALDAERRHPLRQGLAQLLDQAEQIVRTVDLVDLSGLRMSDDGAGAVDPVRNTAVVADQAFGIVFGAKIGVAQALRLIEHVLAKNARIQTGRSNGTGVVEAAGLDRRCQPNGMPGSFDVGDLL